MGKIGNAKTAAAIRASRHTRGLKAYDNVDEMIKDLDDYAFARKMKKSKEAFERGEYETIDMDNLDKLFD